MLKDHNSLNTMTPVRLEPAAQVSKGQNSTFSEHGHVAFKIKLNGIMVANILPADPQTLAVRSKGQNSTVSEYGQVVYQIKWNHECSNMQAHILSLHRPSTPVVGSKVKTFFFESSHVAYQIRSE